MRCSIIIPTKDRPAGLERAVASALAALPENAEIVVVDDASTMAVADILAPLAHPALRIVQNPGPHGPSGARNFGASAARGDVLFFLDDDDELLPEYCRRVLLRLPELPESCGFGFCAATGNARDGSRGAGARDEGVIPLTAPLDARLAGLGMGFWIRRDLFERLGGLDPQLWVNEDTEFCVRLARAGVEPHFDPVPGVALHKDEGRDGRDLSSVTRSARSASRAAGFEYILREHRDFLRDHGAFRRKTAFRALKYRARAGMVRGWAETCQSLQPGIESFLFRFAGILWLWAGAVTARAGRVSRNRDTA